MIEMSAVTTPVDEVSDVDTLQVADRCVRCGAQALVRVQLSSGATLDFCAHDYRESKSGLDEKGAVVVVDERQQLSH